MSSVESCFFFLNYLGTVCNSNLWGICWLMGKISRKGAKKKESVFVCTWLLSNIQTYDVFAG